MEKSPRLSDSVKDDTTEKAENIGKQSREGGVFKYPNNVLEPKWQ